MDDLIPVPYKKRQKTEANVNAWVTNVTTKHLLEADYSEIKAVNENLDELKADRIKGKYSPSYHVEVLTKMVEQMPVKAESDIEVKISVILYLIGTIF